MLKKTLEHIEKIKGLMVDYVTDKRNDEQSEIYKSEYLDIHFMFEELGYENPNKFSTLEEFWVECKTQLPSYADRRAYINKTYSDIILDIQRKLRNVPEPKEWVKTNELLTDKLTPIRRQWLKAKNFLISSEPDFENCIKESTNSIESTLQILLDKPNETLGTIIKSADIDPDIKKLISKMYGLMSNKDFVRHGGTIVQDIKKSDAEFFLDFSSITIQYLKKRITE